MWLVRNVLSSAGLSLDRKSTRLNSSHEWNSYAVFCLKKKSGIFFTGALRMRSRVDLNLSAGATLLFSDDPERFPPVRTRYEGLECVNRSPMLYAGAETDVTVTGRRTLDASRTAAWNRGSDRDGGLEPMVARALAPDERVVVGRPSTAR